jgi:hypothetical protein
VGAIYGGSANRTQRQQNDFGGGLNSGFSSFDIADNESSDEYGWDTDLYPAKRTAKGREEYGDSTGNVTRLLTNFGQQHLVRALGATLQYDSGGGSWTNITGTWANTDWDATNFNDLLLLVNGTERKKWNGSTLSNIGGSPPAGAKYITNDNVRVWMAVGDTIHFSAFQDQDDWTSAENSGSVQYYTPNGGDITALKEYYGDKWVFKRDSMAVIKGTNYFNFALVSVSNDIGCVSFKTIKEVGDTMFWLGENDVYAHQGGKPAPIGQKIRHYLTNINKSYLDKCCAITDGLRYYLCLVFGAATEPNVRLVYDPRYGTWDVCESDSQSTLPERYRYSAQLSNVAYAGDASGYTWVFNSGEVNNDEPIEWSVTTKPFDEGYPEAEKQYKEIHLQGYFPPGTTLQVAFSTSDLGSDWTTIDYNPFGTAAVSQNKNCIIPLDSLPLTHWARFRISGSGPVELQQMQRYFKVCRVQR